VGRHLKSVNAGAKPVLSVITPVFNAGRFLTSTLESVFRLSTQHEHIVVDGGSTDGTIELLAGRDDPSLRWLSEPDRGQTDAVNKGFERAKGELVCWLNGDDEYISDAVDRAAKHLLEHPSVDAVFGGMHVIDEHGTVRRRYQPAGYSWRRYLFFGDYIPTPSIIFRRSLLERVGSLDEAYEDAADYDFYLRLFHTAQVNRMPEALIRFRCHPDSKTARDVWLQQREALEIRLKWARGRGDRLVMESFDLAKRKILPHISSWPKLYS
jgi:glycosyltransferase involved in cell wall biosynthesis